MPIRGITQHTHNRQDGARNKIKLKNQQFFYYHRSRVSTHKKKIPTINNNRHRKSRASEFVLHILSHKEPDEISNHILSHKRPGKK